MSTLRVTAVHLLGSINTHVNPLQINESSTVECSSMAHKIIDSISMKHSFWKTVHLRNSKEVLKRSATQIQITERQLFIQLHYKSTFQFHRSMLVHLFKVFSSLQRTLGLYTTLNKGPKANGSFMNTSSFIFNLDSLLCSHSLCNTNIIK